MRTRFLSYIRSYPAHRLVHSSFGFYGRVRGGRLPGTWFVHALAACALTEGAVRQTLHRMERSGELQAARTGRDKLYRPSSLSWAAIDAGAAKLMEPPPGEWDGEWTFVHSRFSAEERIPRERVRTILKTEGFGALAPSVFVHPRDRADRVLEAVRNARLTEHLVVIRGRRQDALDDRRFVNRVWDLRSIQRRYRSLMRRYGPLAGNRRRLDPQTAFIARFAVVLDYLEVAWDDPGLPLELLPENWPGQEAFELVNGLNRRWLPRAREFGDQVLSRVRKNSTRLLEAYPRLGT